MFLNTNPITHINTTTPLFRSFLYSIMSAIKLHQHIAIYYDLSHLSREDANILEKDLALEYEKFYNITFFTDFVPGFLTNPKGISLLTKKPNFTFVIFLNFNPRSVHQNILLNEIITFKYEYILFSASEIDLVAFVPYLYLNLDLNDLGVLKIINFYLFQYISLFIDLKTHNTLGDLHIQTLYNYNCFFILTIIEDNYLLSFYLHYFFKEVKKNSKNNSINFLLKVLLLPTKFKSVFLNKYYSPNFIKIINTDLYQKSLKYNFIIKLKLLFSIITNKFKIIKKFNIQTNFVKFFFLNLAKIKVKYFNEAKINKLNKHD